MRNCFVRIVAIAMVIVSILVPCTSAFADFTNMVPKGTTINKMDPNLLSVFKDGSIDTSSVYGKAAYLVTAILAYMQEVDDDFSVNTGKTMFFGTSMERHAGVFMGETGSYICVLYDTEADTAAWYLMDTTKALEASSILESAMPNNDCVEVSSSAFSSVVDQLLDSVN